jgi:hypothetical protein
VIAKMKKIFLIICVLLVHVDVQAQMAWNKIYDFSSDPDRLSNSIAQYADNDVLVTAGHIQPNAVTDHICYISTLDYQGNIIASKTLEAAGKVNMMAGKYFDYNAYPLTKVANDRYLLCGVEEDKHANSTHFTVYQPFFYFFNSQCDSLRMVKYTDTIISQLPYSAIVDKNGDIVVSGMESSRKKFGVYWDSGYVWIAKYDANANLKWSKKMMPADNHGTANSVLSTGFKVINGDDGKSYFVCGSAFDQSKGSPGLFVMKTDIQGDALWVKFLPRQYPTWGAMDIALNSAGNIMFVATIGEPQPNEEQTYYGELNSVGDTVWTKSFRKFYTGTIKGLQISVAENDDLLILSKSLHYNHTHGIIRTTPKGNIKWYREYMFADTTYFNHELVSIGYTPKRQIFLTGSFTSFAPKPGIFDTAGLYSWFVLTDTFGCIEPGCQVGDTVWWLTDVNEVAARPVNINIYPNPAKDVVYIEAGNTTKKLHAVLQDMSGRALRHVPLHGNNKTPVDVADLPQGLYMVEVWDDVGRVKVMKLEHY